MYADPTSACLQLGLSTCVGSLQPGVGMERVLLLMAPCGSALTLPISPVREEPLSLPFYTWGNRGWERGVTSPSGIHGYHDSAWV